MARLAICIVSLILMLAIVPASATLGRSLSISIECDKAGSGTTHHGPAVVYPLQNPLLMDRIGGLSLLMVLVVFSYGDGREDDADIECDLR